jgi:hypothetical protein
MSSTSSEDLATSIAVMGRSELIELLRSTPCTFRLDFTEAFLRTVSLEKLRHIALAASLHIRQRARTGA